MIDFIAKLGPARVAAVMGTALLVIGFFIFMMFRVTTPNYTMLFGELELDSVRNISEKLADQGVKFDIRNSNSEVWVDEELVGDLRLSMASEGLGGSILGYEIFDRDSALGQSNLVQEVNRLRALEGELSRTIAGLENVNSARVHIVLPKRELFTRDKQTTKASIVLKMKGGDRLSGDQVKAIQHLVSTAIPELMPSNITIVDNKGGLLHAGGDTDGSAMAMTEGNEMRQAYEQELATKVTQLLEQTVGFGKVRVEVNVDMDFSEQVENHSSFNPDEQVARSTENILENARASEGTDGSVTVANNLPDAEQFSANAGGINESSNRTEERINFEISNVQVNKITPPGRVLRLSVAAMVDGAYIEDGESNFIYQERTEEEIITLRSLVQSAVGFDPARGDVVELVNMQFVDTAPVPEVKEKMYLGFTVKEIKGYVEYLAIAGVFVLIMLFVVRPMVLRIMDFRDAMEEAEELDKDKPKVVLNQYGQVVEIRPDSEASIGGEGGKDGKDIESLIDIAHVEGQIKASSLRRIGELIDKHPEEAVGILRNWIYSDSNP
ncbi:MAG: flagellar basal-body MS-ring/collar protein FliF [Alphaproteobacteria bacterium]